VVGIENDPIFLSPAITRRCNRLPNPSADSADRGHVATASLPPIRSLLGSTSDWFCQVFKPFELHFVRSIRGYLEGKSSVVTYPIPSLYRCLQPFFEHAQIVSSESS